MICRMLESFRNGLLDVCSIGLTHCYACVCILGHIPAHDIWPAVGLFQAVKFMSGTASDMKIRPYSSQL